jgi:amiloride-sensitive sodium channel
MQAMFHDPEDYPDSGLKTALVEPGRLVTVKLEAQIIESVNDVRRVNVDSRQCWFDDEVAVVQSSPSYSVDNCITECRIKVFQENCGCIPFFYPLVGQYFSLNYHVI